VAFNVSQYLDGATKTLAILAGLKVKIVKKITRHAMVKATAVLRKTTRTARGTSAWRHADLHKLRKSLSSKVFISKDGKVFGLVGARTGDRIQIGSVASGPNKGAPIYYDPSKVLHLVEGGHGGPHPAPPHPFMKPALEASTSAIETTLETELNKGIADAVAK
jgi:hypothetical protein